MTVRHRTVRSQRSESRLQQDHKVIFPSLCLVATFLTGMMVGEVSAHSPSIVAGPPPPASAFPMPAPYKSQHAEEDFRYLQDPAQRTDPFDSLKYIRLFGKDEWFLSLGGEARERYEYFNNFAFGRPPQDHGGYFLQRYMFFGDVHLGRNLRVFSEFKSASINYNHTPARPTDENQFDLHQAFVDFAVDLPANTTITVRPGRQELAFGATRLVALRDAPNDRQTFDGVRVMATGEGWRVDGFAVRPVRTRPGVMDDVSDPTTDFWGLYGVKSYGATSKGGVNLYYFGLNRDTAAFNDLNGRETRHTIGARVFDRIGSWDYDLEGTFQWGRFGSGDIQAWRIALDGGYHFSSLPLRPRPHFQVDVMSGDRQKGDHNTESFNPLFPKGHYFGLIGLLGPVNLINIHPSLDFQLTEKIRATTKIDFFWRQSSNDGVYNPAGAILRAAQTSKAMYVGSEVQVELYWEITRHLVLITNYTHFFTGQFLRDTGFAKQVDYTAAWVTFRF